jgi:hypothetical protein
VWVECDDGSPENVEIQPKGRAGGPESTEIRLLKVKVTWRAGLNFGTESFLPMTEFFYRILFEPVVVCTPDPQTRGPFSGKSETRPGFLD